MKKVLIIFSILLLASCTTNEQPKKLECTNLQFELDETCIDLTGPQIQLKTAIENTNEIDNYRLQIIITDETFLEDVSIEVLIDQNMAQMTVYDLVTTYETDDQNCQQTQTFNETGQSIGECVLPMQTIYKNLNFLWFELDEGIYKIKEEFISELNVFNLEELPVLDVFLLINANYISEVTIQYDQLTIQYTISNIDEVNLGE